MALKELQDWKELLAKQPDSEHILLLRKLIQGLEEQTRVRAAQEEAKRRWYMDNLPWEEITALVLTLVVVGVIAAIYFWIHHLPHL